MTELSVQDDNATRQHVADAVASGRRNVPLDANPALVNLSAVLIESRDGELTIGFTAPQCSTQGNGVVSGGTLAGMLDMAMAMAVLAQLPPGSTCATISLTVNMQAAGLQGPFVAKAGVKRIGRQIAFAHAELRDPSRNRLIADGISSLSVFSVRLQPPLP